MKKEVLFYYDESKEDCKVFCEQRNITYLPCKNALGLCYTLEGDRFKQKKIEESQKVNIEDKLFDASIRDKFQKHQVLFVFMKDVLCGVVHFSDYNRNPVAIYVYSLLLEFERKLRELLIYEGLNNNDMLTFFEKQVEKGDDNGHYSKKTKDYKKPEKQKERKELEQFQTFFLKDLIDLLQYKGLYSVPTAINRELRNPIMHAKNVVRHEDYENSSLIYNFKSFRDFLELVGILRLETVNISKKIPVELNEEEYVIRLRNAGLFVKLQ